MSAFEIPLTPEAQSFTVSLGGADYLVTLRWCAPAACWTLDLATAAGAAIVSGLALVTGCDMLGQFAYLGIPGRLVAQSFGNSDAVPDLATLGIASALFFVTP